MNMDVDRRLLLLPFLSLLLLLSLSSLSLAPLCNLIYTPSSTVTTAFFDSTEEMENLRRIKKKVEELANSKIAVCLVGGARRFELTGPSIIEKVLKVYPNADLFLNSPLDHNSFKLSLLKDAPRVAWLQIFEPGMINETEPMVRVLNPMGSPNGIKGLLQYFNLVEGCITMIKAYQTENNFTYDWIIRTRVDGYWSDPLDPDYFIPGQYLVPPGSSYGGLNDRFGVGDFNTSTIALSRLSLIPDINSAGFTRLNSESAFKAQLTTHHVPYVTKPLPFCIVTDRTYNFPPNTYYGIPVTSLSSAGPLNGAKCRPCTVACSSSCVAEVMGKLNKEWGWTENEAVELCDAHGEWEDGWEKIFDDVAGEKLASARKRVGGFDSRRCVEEFDEMKRKTVKWESPTSEKICMLGLRPN